MLRSKVRSLGFSAGSANFPILGTIHKRRLPKGGGRGVQKKPKKETFTSRFEETRGGRVPQKSKIWGDVFYGWSLRQKSNFLFCTRSLGFAAAAAAYCHLFEESKFMISYCLGKSPIFRTCP